MSADGITADIVIEPADPGWIIVPGPAHIDSAPSTWATEEAARHVPRGRSARAWLAEALTRIVSMTGENEVHALFAPDPGNGETMLVRVRYAYSDGDRNPTLRDLVLSGDGTLREPVEPEPYPSRGLGDGLRSVTTRETEDGSMLVRACAFRRGPYDLRISAADLDAERLDRLGPDVDELVDSIRLQPDPDAARDAASGAAFADLPPSDVPIVSGAEDSWLRIPDELGAIEPLKRSRRARKLAGKLLPKRAFGVLEPIGLDETSVLLGALGGLSGPGEHWFTLRRTLPQPVLVRVRWSRHDRPTTDDLVAATRSDPRSGIRVGDAEPVRGPDGGTAQVAAWTDGAVAGVFLAFPRDGHVVQARLEAPKPLLAEARVELDRLVATIRIDAR